MTFKQLGLSTPILKAVTAQGYSEPSPIQAKAIPAILDGHDLMAAAQTGTGKTAGFAYIRAFKWRTKSRIESSALLNSYTNA